MSAGTPFDPAPPRAVDRAAPLPLSSRERFWLWVAAGLGLAGINGAFVYTIACRPDQLRAALTNPIAAAFIAEAFLLVAVCSFLLARWRVSRLSWPWFVLLSLLGGLAFSIPVAILYARPGGAARGARGESP